MPIQKHILSGLSSMLWLPVDVFMCCACFEDRCRSVADVIEPESIERAFIAENMNLSRYVDKNADYLRNRFGQKTVEVPIDSGIPLQTADTLIDRFEELRDDYPLNFLVDITTFTHESLLILIKILHQEIQHNQENTVTIVYTSAKEYDSPRRKEDKWLSKGICDIRSVLGYPGEIVPSRKTHLIVLVGYEHERAAKLIEVFEPNAISLGYGKRGSSPEGSHYDVNAHFKKLVEKTAAVYGTIDDFEFACNNPLDAKETILGCIQVTDDYNHVIAPMNTKISTLASALLALADDKIQLCYAQAALYNYENYSIPGDTCYLLDLKKLLRLDGLAV